MLLFLEAVEVFCKKCALKNFVNFTGKHRARVSFLVCKFIQKQPSRCVLIKRCSENMQQVYRRTHKNHFSAWVFFFKFEAYFGIPFYKNTSIRLLFFIKKEIVVQMFSCEFCEIFRNTFFYRIPSVAAPVIREI